MYFFKAYSMIIKNRRSNMSKIKAFPQLQTTNSNPPFYFSWLAVWQNLWWSLSVFAGFSVPFWQENLCHRRSADFESWIFSRFASLVKPSIPCNHRWLVLTAGLWHWHLPNRDWSCDIEWRHRSVSRCGMWKVQLLQRFEEKYAHFGNDPYTWST